MSKTPKILAFAGSLREDSFNKKMVQVAAHGAKQAGAEVTFIDLKFYELPIFDQGLEDKDGMPENAQKLKDLMIKHDGFLIASPEYNSSVTAALKNVIDWTSRASSPDEPPLPAYDGKVAVIMSASPGGLGGLRGLVHLRAILGNIKVIVLPGQLAIANAHEEFDKNGGIKDEKKHKSVEKLGSTLAEFLKKLKDAG